MLKRFKNLRKDLRILEKRELPYSGLSVEVPIIQVVNSLIEMAVQKEASDIHIEPGEGGLRFRLRIDGVLHEAGSPPLELQHLILSRIKIMSSLDIAERRLPQDGSLVFQEGGRVINMRVSTLPTVFGEKIVLRLLDRDRIILDINKLGLSTQNASLYQNFILASHGMILVTGPTGCGKTTTLYSTLNHLNSPAKNIISVEDPVECYLEGVNQVQVKTKIGYSFGDALRTILRQDPNIIMIGEIRDEETAEIATRAALTGHLVLTTLHTNDATKAITRLLDMGVKSFLLISSLIGIIAQRLVRLLCPLCKEAYQISVQEEKMLCPELAGAVFYRHRGCSGCNHTGFKGRLAIHEVMALTEEMKSVISSNPSAADINLQANRDGLISLKEDGLAKAAQGLTTISEVLRVIYTGV